MSESSFIGKALMRKRPQEERNGDEQLDNLDYFINSEISLSDDKDDEKDSHLDEHDQNENISIVEDEDVDVFHMQNIDAYGNVKEFDIYDSDLPDDLEVGTSTAAKALGVTEQTIRNYCNDYDEFLDVRKESSGHRKIKIKTLRKLDNIMQIKDERKYDREQMKAYLRNEGKEALVVTEAERMNALADAVSDRVIDRLSSFFQGDEFPIGDLLDFQKKSMESNAMQFALLSERIEKSYALLCEKEEEIKKLADMITLKSESESGEKINKLERELQEEKDKAISVNNEFAKLKQELEELQESSKKRKKWFKFSK